MAPHSRRIDNTARISIVMLTHNDRERTRRCIDMMLEALPDALFEELLILDNASTDGTREYVRSLADIEKVQVLTSDVNLGVAQGRRRLFARARGEIVASLDSDVEIRGSGYLRKARALLAADPRIGICGASGYRVHFTGGRLGLVPHERDGDVDCVSGFCQVFPRHLLQQIGIDTDFSPFWCEDTDFCFQAKAQGWRIRRLGPGADLAHRYRSLETRCEDPRKAEHEAMLVRKWAGRVHLLGERPWPRARRRLRRSRADALALVARLRARAGALLRRALSWHRP
jgi:O-antigen biosynthesis protein